MTIAQTSLSELERRDLGNRRIARRLLLVVAAALVFAFAQVPLYRAFCEWTGIYDVARAEALSRSALPARSVALLFDANVQGEVLRFTPQTTVASARTGELVHATYLVENLTDRVVIGQAVPSYGPNHAASYVKKLDCFCFKQQTFAPHERRELSVTFAIDRELPEDVVSVALSYTFFEVPGGAPAAAAVRGGS